MTKQRLHIKLIGAFILTISLFDIAAKPLHYLWVSHSTYTKSEQPRIDVVSTHCGICDYHFSPTLLVDFSGIQIAVILLFTFLVLYGIKLVSENVSERHNKGPPTLFA